MEKALFAAPFLVLLVPLLNWLQSSYGAVPWHGMGFWYGDLTPYRAPKPISYLANDTFRIAFEGHTFDGTSGKDGTQVDGRDAPWSYWWALQKPTEWKHDDAGGTDSFGREQIQLLYSERQRLLVIKIGKHKLQYSRHLKKLTVNGTPFSTEKAPLRLLVRNNGSVIELDASHRLSSDLQKTIDAKEAQLQKMIKRLNRLMPPPPKQ